MTLDSAIARFRAREQELMRSECTVARAAAGEYDPETMTWSNTPDEVYSGPCMIRPGGRVGEDDEQGDRETSSMVATGKFPFEDAPTFELGDVVTVTSSPDVPAGTVFRIAALPRNDWTINRVAQLEEVRRRGPSR